VILSQQLICALLARPTYQNFILPLRREPTLASSEVLSPTPSPARLTSLPCPFVFVLKNPLCNDTAIPHGFGVDVRVPNVIRPDS